jgi:cysteine desulfurase
VIAVMRNALESSDLFGNSSSAHEYGWRAQEKIEEARRYVADAIHADPKEIIWTSGATESDNLALKGAAYFNQSRGKHIITLQTEHKAILDTCEQLQGEGFEITYLRPQTNGLLNLDDLKKALRTDTILVSVMHVNNETGVVQDIKMIADVVKSHGALFHVDAAQSIGKISLNVQEINADLISLSAHKVYGPKGIGALYVRRQPRVRLTPLIHGGGQEQGLRSGTLPTYQVIGMGEAFKIAKQESEKDLKHISQLYEILLKGLNNIPGIIFNADRTHCVPGIVNISCEDVEGESLLLALEPTLAVSSGSACTTATIEPSHVLLAMGVSSELAHASLRLSFGRFTTSNEIEKTIATLHEQLSRLREIGSAWGK